MGASQFNLILVIAAIGVGGALAWVSGKRVAMTDMPQMIALYNGMGGGAAAAIAAVELYARQRDQRGASDHGDGRRLHRRGVLQRQPHRLRQAAGLDHQIGALRRTEIRQSRHPAGHRRLRFHGGVGHRSGRDSRGHAVLRRRADARRRHDAADRRRRHARGDFALQRAHGTRGRLRGLRARQRGDDHRRYRGRRRGHPVDAAHGEGHESIARQRAVLELRRDLRGGRRHRAPACRRPSRRRMPA